MPMSASCEYATSPCSFDHLVGADDHGVRNLELEPLGRLNIDDEFKFGRHLRWQVGRIGAAQNTVHIGRRTTEQVNVGRPQRHKTAFKCKDSGRMDGRNLVL